MSVWRDLSGERVVSEQRQVKPTNDPHMSECKPSLTGTTIKCVPQVGRRVSTLAIQLGFNWVSTGFNLGFNRKAENA